MITLVDCVGKRFLSRGPRPTTRLQLEAYKSDFNLEVGWFEFFHGKTFQEQRLCVAATCGYYHRPMSAFEAPTVEGLRSLVEQLSTALVWGNTFVHCEHGEDRTGIVCAAYRIIKNGWTAKRAKAEMYDLGFNYWFYWFWIPVLDQLYAEQMELEKIITSGFNGA